MKSFVECREYDHRQVNHMRIGNNAKGCATPETQRKLTQYRWTPLSEGQRANTSARAAGRRITGETGLGPSLYNLSAADKLLLSVVRCPIGQIIVRQDKLLSVGIFRKKSFFGQTIVRCPLSDRTNNCPIRQIIVRCPIGQIVVRSDK